MVKDGVKRTVVGGKPSGECYVVFEKKEDAYNATGLHLEKIGQRFIEIFPATPREFESYLMVNFTEAGPTYSKDNLPNIPTDKRKQTLLVRGLPFTFNKTDVATFFNSFKITDENIHLVSGAAGRFTGDAIVIFEDELDAERAIKTKNLAYVDGRYVELKEY